MDKVPNYETPLVEECTFASEQLLMASSQDAELVGMPGEDW